ncbi:ketopantoate reductase family protein [Bordetella sp. BOR01]|uniref:ketopantoate reductase family protein n=1 Tax=Bordetella sp. BOR01 TaxID=2854779 RepID=UPI001C4737E9|nr:2-dehydropantoate 2-reductase [Bordetella sp. BOR01]MBV7483388.1 2-dehydropantoate 2-reductase [Bordetella sp. BOR01]
MKIAIIGCGAMGSVYAGLLGSRGNDVLVVDHWAEHIQAMADKGLHLTGASGDRQVTLRAYSDVPQETVDLVIIASKAAQAGAAARQARPLLGPSTVVLTIQNGLGSADDVAQAVGAERLAIGIAAAFGASLPQAGHAHHNGMAAVRMGAYATLGTASLERVAAVWQDAGFNAEPVQDVAAMQWEKLICNVAYSAPCTLSGLTVGQVMADTHISGVSQAAATEAWQIARARGIALSVTDPIAHVQAFGARIPDAKPSVMLDHERGRISEIDYINGAIAKEAGKCSKAAPVNATLTALVKQRESSFTTARTR